MGTTLTGTTPQDTYDSLIKVTDNGPLSGSLKVLTDGLGNNSALSLSTAAASVTGTLAVSSNATLTSSGISVRLGSATANAGANILIAGASSTKNWSLGVQQNVSGGLEFTPTATNGATTLGTAPAMVILDAGNVGIAQTSPAAKLEVGGTSANTDFRISRTVDPTAYTYITAPGGATLTAAIGISGTDVFSIDTNKYIRFAAASGGIQFNGDTAAANALDDYEEGTWTMGVTFGGNAVGVTYANTTGIYTKIGRQVTVNGFLRLSNKGSSTGSAKITGLPFTVGNATGNLAGAALRFDTITFANQFMGHAEDNTTTIALEEITEAGAVSTLTNADFANSCSIIVGLTYFV